MVFERGARLQYPLSRRPRGLLPGEARQPHEGQGNVQGEGRAGLLLDVEREDAGENRGKDRKVGERRKARGERKVFKVMLSLLFPLASRLSPLRWHELERDAVVAVALARRLRTVVEEVPLVPAAARAVVLGARENQLEVGLRVDTR